MYDLTAARKLPHSRISTMSFILLRRLGTLGARYGLWLPLLSAFCIGSCSLLFSEPSSAPDARTKDADARTKDAAASSDDADVSTNDASVCVSPTIDQDNDGFPCPNDCVDSDGSINPGAAEICNNVDDDCDDVIDEAVCP